MSINKGCFAKPFMNIVYNDKIYVYIKIKVYFLKILCYNHLEHLFMVGG